MILNSLFSLLQKLDQLKNNSESKKRKIENQYFINSNTQKSRKYQKKLKIYTSLRAKLRK